MTDTNNQLILVSGVSASGKSASLRNIRDQEKWAYLNTEAGKRLPFKNSFHNFRVSDPFQVHEAFTHFTGDKDNKGIIVDSLTFLLDMLETQYVLTAANTMKAWSDFQQFFKVMMQELVVGYGKPVIFIAHTRSDLNEQTMEMQTAVPVKGALKNNGVESYFSTVVSAKTIPIKKLENFKNDMLTITEDEETLGYKHVFQTRLTKETVGERIRSPMGMFSKEETYIDNDVQVLLDHLDAYYN